VCAWNHRPKRLDESRHAPGRRLPGRTACRHWDRRAGADPAAAWLARQSRRGPEIAPQALRLLFITNGPTTPAHFVRVVEIFARELVLPRLNDALRVADHILHFARDFDFLKGLQRSSGGCAVPEANTDEAVRIQEEESAIGNPRLQGARRKSGPGASRNFAQPNDRGSDAELDSASSPRS